MESTVLPQKRPRPHSNLLSFESDPDDEEPALVKRPLGKNPDVCTEFLPDPSAEEEKRIERERLCQIYEAEQTKVKNRPAASGLLRILGRNEQSLLTDVAQVNLSGGVPRSRHRSASETLS